MRRSMIAAPISVVAISMIVTAGCGSGDQAQSSPSSTTTTAARGARPPSSGQSRGPGDTRRPTDTLPAAPAPFCETVGQLIDQYGPLTRPEVELDRAGDMYATIGTLDKSPPDPVRDDVVLVAETGRGAKAEFDRGGLRTAEDVQRWANDNGGYIKIQTALARVSRYADRACANLA
jgi:hypothetical protein